MSKKLSQNKLDQMFKAYIEKQSVQFVSRKCSVSPTTVTRYKRLQDWDGRLGAIQRKAQEKQDDNLATLIANNMKYLKFTKSKLMTVIKDCDVISKNPVSDFDRLVRLELYLMGEVESRTAITETSGLEHLSIDELLELKKKLKQAQKDAESY